MICKECLKHKNGKSDYCRSCTTKRLNRLSIDDVQKRIFDVHQGVITLDVSTYVDTRTKAKFIDNEFGEWYAQPHNVMNGSGNPKRHSVKNVQHLRSLSKMIASRPIEQRRRMNVDDVKKKLQEMYGDELSLDEQSYISMCRDAIFIHKEFGVWKIQPHELFKHKLKHPFDRVRKPNTPIQHIKNVIEQVHKGVVTIDETTYKGVNCRARFFDKEFGEWISYPTNVMKGTSHPYRSAKKKRIKSFAKYDLLHWKTNELIRVTSEYELRVVQWLNYNSYDYDWQVPFETPFMTPVRNMPSIYYVDLFIKNGPYENLYVEIKGTWARKNGEIGKMKWDWFHKEHKNSVLWMKNEINTICV